MLKKIFSIIKRLGIEKLQKEVMIKKDPVFSGWIHRIDRWEYVTVYRCTGGYSEIYINGVLI